MKIICKMSDFQKRIGSGLKKLDFMLLRGNPRLKLPAVQGSAEKESSRIADNFLILSRWNDKTVSENEAKNWQFQLQAPLRRAQKA